eukprot:3832509-Rhodomonas_salina.2
MRQQARCPDAMPQSCVATPARQHEGDTAWSCPVPCMRMTNPEKTPLLRTVNASSLASTNRSPPSLSKSSRCAQAR